MTVACFCGFTKQYPGFEALQKKFGDKFTVIAFPCNQFGGQEPGTPAQIKEFVKQFGELAGSWGEGCEGHEGKRGEGGNAHPHIPAF